AHIGTLDHQERHTVYGFSVPKGDSLPSLARRMGMASVPYEYDCKWEKVEEDRGSDEEGDEIETCHYSPRN
ncbi:hypothetical protein PENTCL1PPCAC_2881, partial [Pristionchus entomophagus]